MKDRRSPFETLKSRLTSTSMRLDTSSPVLYTSASMADVQHPKLPLLLLLFLRAAQTPVTHAGPWALHVTSTIHRNGCRAGRKCAASTSFC